MDRPPVPRSPLYMFCAQSHKHTEQVCAHYSAELSLTKSNLAGKTPDPNPLFTYFQTVTPISLSVYYVKNIFMDLFSLQERSGLVLFLSHRTQRSSAQAQCEVKPDWQCGPVPRVPQGTQHQSLPVRKCSSDTGREPGQSPRPDELPCVSPSSTRAGTCEKPLAQLFPAPPPCSDR